MDYLLTSCLISITALAVYGLLNNAPARLRFYVVITALFAWFVPWNMVSTLNFVAEPFAPILNELFNVDQLIIPIRELQITKEQSANALLATQSDLHWLSLLSVSNIFWLLMSVGGLLFCAKINAYLRLLHHCQVDSQPAEHLWQKYQLDAGLISLRVTGSCNMAMATGIRKPIVWLSAEFMDSPHLRSILIHELNHIRQHDPAWMWFITFVHSAFWWNPLVRVLVTLARQNIEISCDERCRHHLSNEYSRDLALLILHRHTQTNVTYSVMPVSHFRNFNVNRIKRLSKETTMKTRYVLIAIVGLTLSFLTAATISETSKTANEEPGQAKEQTHSKSISVYNGNAQHDKQIDELLVINKQAKSKDLSVLEDVYHNLVKWYENRAVIQDRRSENSLKLVTFTMMSYLLNKLDRPQEILSHYDDMFNGIPLKQVLFLQHHRAIAYMQSGSPDKGVELLEQVVEFQPVPKDGSLLLLALAYLQNNDGANAVRVTEQIESKLGRPNVQLQALNLKRAAYAAMGDEKKANQLNQLLVDQYGQQGWQPQMYQMASPLLRYLPDAE